MQAAGVMGGYRNHEANVKDVTAAARGSQLKDNSGMQHGFMNTECSAAHYASC